MKAECILRLDMNRGDKKPKVDSINFNLQPSQHFDKSMYVEDDGLLTKHGSNALTQVLVQSLIGNIHQAHQRGLIDSAEHLRKIISELERGFVAQVDYSIGRMGDGEE
jgi:hypothetical protein